MCGGGNKTTTTSTQAPNPQALGYYNQAFGLASNVANTPTSAVPLQGVANLSSEQNAGIGGINQYANAAQPYYQQAATYANNAATPITAQQIQNYQNPYTQQVVNSTENQFNLMNQQALENIKGNAAAQGALGGDRAGSVAPAAYYGAVLPGQEQQIAGLYSQGYNTATQTALAEQQAQAQGAYSLGNIGAGIQNSGISGAGAQLGAGQLQQQYGPDSQAALSALYAQQQGQFQLPFQESQLLTGAAGSLGSQMGGTSTTQAPPPNIFSQIAGLGIGGLGLAGALGWKPLGSNRGGRIKGYDLGGAVPFAGSSNMIQIAPQQRHGGMGMPAFPKAVDPNAAFNSIGQQGLQLANTASRSMHPQPPKAPFPPSVSPGTIGGTGANIQDPSNPGTGNGLYSQGGMISTGGAVDEPPRDPNGIYVPRGFADGGDTFDQRFGTWPPQPDLPPDTTFDEKETQQLGLGKPVDWGASQDAPAVPTLPPATTVAPAGGYNSNDAASPASGEGTGIGAGGNNSIPSLVAPTTGADQPSATSSKSGIPQDAWLALAHAGFGIAGGASPYAGINIGRGAQQGLEAYQQEQKQRLTFEQEAKKLAQQADQFQKSLAQQKELHNAITPYQQAEVGLKQRQQSLAEMQPVPLGIVQDAWGTKTQVMGIKDPKTGAYHRIDPATGQISSQPITAPGTQAPQSQTQTPLPQGVPKVAPFGAPPSNNGYQVLDVKSTPTAPDGVTPAINANFVLASEAKAEQDMAKGEGAPQGLNPQALQENAQMAPLIKMLDEGRLQVPANALRGADAPFWRHLISATADYDPSFDTTNYNVRRALRTSYLGAGKMAQNNQSFNMALQHVGELSDAIEGLHNYSTLPVMNRVTGAAAGQYDPHYQEALSKFEIAKKAVSDELMRSFRGAGSASQKEAEDWSKALDAYASPVSLRSATKEAIKLLSGRIEANGDTWNQTMGPASRRDPLAWLSPKARDTYDRIASMDPQRGPSAGQQQGQPPAAAPTQRQIGQTVTTTKGTFKWNGSGWDPAQ